MSLRLSLRAPRSNPASVIPGRAPARTSDARLHIGESRDSGFDAAHRPGMTASGLLRGARNDAKETVRLFVMAGQRLRARCPGHPRLSCCGAVKTWMPGTSPGMTSFAIGAGFNAAFQEQASRWGAGNLSAYFDAVFLFAMLTTCTRRFTSASGLAGSLSLLLP